MPYINQKQREKYQSFLDTVKKMEMIETKGDLEYLVYLLMLKFMSTRLYHYTDLHDVVYAIIHAGEEFKRQNLDKRENLAKQENGDIDV